MAISEKLKKEREENIDFVVSKGLQSFDLTSLFHNNFQSLTQEELNGIIHFIYREAGIYDFEKDALDSFSIHKESNNKVSEVTQDYISRRINCVRDNFSCGELTDTEIDNICFKMTLIHFNSGYEQSLD